MTVALFTGALGWYAVGSMERMNAGQRTLVVDVFGGTYLMATWIDQSTEARLDLLAYVLTDDAHDLTQEFFARLLERNDLAAVDRSKGRFRSFLLTACKHFLCNEHDRAHTRKRGGGRAPGRGPELLQSRWQPHRLEDVRSERE